MRLHSSLLGHSSPVTSLRIHKKTLASASEDGYLRLWDITTGSTLRTHNSTPINALSSTDSLLYYATESSLHILDDRLSSHPSIHTASDEINSIDTSASLLVLSDDSGAISLLDVRMNRIIYLYTHSSIAMTAVFRPKSNQVWSGGLDCSIFQLNATTNKLTSIDFSTGTSGIAESEKCINPPHIHSIAFNPKGNFAAIGLGNGSVKLLSKPAKNKKDLLRNWNATEYNVHDWSVSALEWFDESLVSGGIDGKVSVMSFGLDGTMNDKDTQSINVGRKINAICVVHDQDSKRVAVGGTVKGNDDFSIDLFSIQDDV